MKILAAILIITTTSGHTTTVRTQSLAECVALTSIILSLGNPPPRALRCVPIKEKR